MTSVDQNIPREFLHSIVDSKLKDTSQVINLIWTPFFILRCWGLKKGGLSLWGASYVHVDLAFTFRLRIQLESMKSWFFTSLRATSHMSQEPWPWNCESPKESVQRPSQDHVMWLRIFKCSVKSYVTGPSTKCYVNEFSIHVGPHTW